MTPSMSAKRGLAPTKSAQLDEATKLTAVVSISSPGPEAGGGRRGVQRAGAVGERDGVACAHGLGERRLELLDERSLRDQRTPQRVRDRSDVLVGDVLAAVRKEVGHATGWSVGSTARRSSAVSHSVFDSLE